MFGSIAHQLTKVIEIGQFNEMASISHLSKGSLNRLQSLFLQDVIMPPLRHLIANRKGIAASLTSLSFVQADMMFSTRPLPILYTRDIHDLLDTISDAHFVPNLRSLNVSLGRSCATNPSKQQRIALLDAIYTSAAAHGGWRLTPTKPRFATVKEDTDASQCWCSNNHGNYFVNAEEVKRFGEWCEKQDRYPRWEDFVDGNIHLDINCNGQGLKDLGATTSRLANVHGMSVLPGVKLDMETALSAVTGKTRCVLVQLQSFWGALAEREVVHTTGRWDGVRMLRVEVMPEHWHSTTPTYTRPQQYTKNLGAAVVNNLNIPLWHNLRALSVPAIALQCRDTFPATARCRKHVAAYNFPWLAQCGALVKVQVTNWMTCVGCYEVYEDAAMQLGDIGGGVGVVGGGQSLVDGLAMNIPAGVKAFTISCVFEVAAKKEWKKEVEGDVRAALGDGVEVTFEHVSLEN